MKIKSEIVNSYIDGKSINKYKEEWVFKYDVYMFVEPSYKVDHRK
ncbi:Uncharacterised protein [uncultured Clostridium sp.]|nr:hypothetical protein [uncultured Clostridium sp.]SCK03184.1 Uncharacterised protein [uncultured Clostridium sp.]